jgi:iron complex transport system ATP-binding protein
MRGGKIIADGAPDKIITSSIIEDVYGINADIITHDRHKRCVPIFAQGIK